MIFSHSDKKNALLGVLFIVAIPVFLITLNVTWMVNDIRFYENGFEDNNISSVTGIEDGDLMEVSREIRNYFNSLNEPLGVRTKIFGEEHELFNQREIIHMRDVKRLIWGVYIFGSIAGLYLIGNTGGGFYTIGSGFGPILCLRIIKGAVFTIGFVTIIGISALTGFQKLFKLFHQISFPNDYWILNPSTDFLLMMFPQEFWLHSTLFLGIMVMVQSLVLGSIAGAALFAIRSNRRPWIKGGS